jgi:hypothetical protein
MTKSPFRGWGFDCNFSPYLVVLSAKPLFMKRSFFLFILALFSIASCRLLGGERIKGDGNITAQERSVGSFDGIDVSGSMDVQVIQGPAASVKIEGDQNLLSYVRTDVRNGVLHIDTEDNVNLQPSKDLIVYVTAPLFTDIEISGASNVIGKTPLTGDKTLEVHASGASEVDLDVSVPELRGDISGATTMKLRGKAGSFILDASGSSEVLGLDLITEESDLDLSGASTVKVTANKKIRIDASGSSDVEYRGSANVDQKSSGASSVRKI